MIITQSPYTAMRRTRRPRPAGLLRCELERSEATRCSWRPPVDQRNMPDRYKQWVDTIRMLQPWKRWHVNKRLGRHTGALLIFSHNTLLCLRSTSATWLLSLVDIHGSYVQQRRLLQCIPPFVIALHTAPDGPMYLTPSDAIPLILPYRTDLVAYPYGPHDKNTGNGSAI